MQGPHTGNRAEYTGVLHPMAQLSASSAKGTAWLTVMLVLLSVSELSYPHAAVWSSPPMNNYSPTHQHSHTPGACLQQHSHGPVSVPCQAMTKARLIIFTLLLCCVL